MPSLYPFSFSLHHEMTQKIIIGKLGKTFGVHGWIKVNSFTNPLENILSFAPWFISADEHNWQEIPAPKCRLNGQTIIAQLPGINSPEQAKLYTNQLIGIDRRQLPPPLQNEFYWTDLVGCKVINKQNVALGEVDHLFATISNDVMVVRDVEPKDAKKPRERLIPFLKDVVLHVDLDAKTILVDWDEDF